MPDAARPAAAGGLRQFLSLDRPIGSPPGGSDAHVFPVAPDAPPAGGTGDVLAPTVASGAKIEPGEPGKALYREEARGARCPRRVAPVDVPPLRRTVAGGAIGCDALDAAAVASDASIKAGEPGEALHREEGLNRYPARQGSAGKQHGVAVNDGLVGNILRQGRLADSVGSDQDCVGGVVEEFERHQGFDGGSVAAFWP
jgi:hypothetical protein